MRTLVAVIARWRERRRERRKLPGVVDDLRRRLGEAERKLAVAGGHMGRQHVGLISHARELRAIARTLEATPTLRGRFAHHRKAVLDAAVEAAAAAERAAGATSATESAGDPAVVPFVQTVEPEEATEARG